MYYGRAVSGMCSDGVVTHTYKGETYFFNEEVKSFPQTPCMDVKPREVCEVHVVIVAVV